jgi:thymidylate kinase
MARQRFVILEGPNGSGKTTLRGIVQNLLGQQGDHVIDRFVGSYYVYDRILRPGGFTWGADKWLRELDELEKLYEVRQIVLDCSLDVLRQRLANRFDGHHPWSNEQLLHQRELFNEWHEMCERHGLTSRIYWKTAVTPYDAATDITRWVNDHSAT